MLKVLNFARRLRKDEEGATAIEYGLLAALIAVAIIFAVSEIGGTLQTTFETVNDEINSPTDPGAATPTP
jgi:pilus assembly protein Flp/PilA